ANRGVVSSGVYRLVRHPIYLGYLITHVAFLFATPSPWNVAILVIGDAALLLRAMCEEETLSRDTQYREYQQLVRWRVCPGLFRRLPLLAVGCWLDLSSATVAPRCE